MPAERDEPGNDVQTGLTNIMPIFDRSTLGRIWTMAGSEASILIITTIATNLVRLVSTMILTRLLAPDAFGAVGIIASVFFVLGMITDLGFQSFIVRHPRGTERQFIDVLWTIHAIRGVILTLVAMALAVPVARFLEKPELALPFAAASIIFAIGGFASLSLLTAVRIGLVRRLCAFDLALFVFQTIVGIVAAALLENVWSIIIGMIAHAVLRAILSYTIFPDARHVPSLDRPIFVEFWSFSKIILRSSTLSVLLSQSDKLVLARVFPIDMFGLYAIAASLAAAPFTFVVAYTSKLLYPRYAEAWREAPETLPRIYYSARRRISLLYGIGAGGLIGAAPLIIRVLYDPRYDDASTYLTLLAISPVLALATVSASEFLMATGNAHATVYTNLSRVIWLFIAGTIGFFAIGPIGIAAAAGTIEVAPLILTWILLRRAGVLDVRQEALFLASSMAGAGIGYGATLALSPLF